MPERGDVISIAHLDSERVKISLHDYPYEFVVSVRSDPTHGPVLTELTIRVPDDNDDQTVNHSTVRSVPFRRLAQSAWNFLAKDEQSGQLYGLRGLIQQAMLDGEAVRPTVASQLGISTKTLDRLIKKAKAAGLLEGIELPLSRRPPPRQKEWAS